jgi:hypothetical protein
MKLKELFVDIGLRDTEEDWQWDAKKQQHVSKGLKTRVPSCHSRDKRMVYNHMDDEVPFYVKLGPIAIFAVRIPTAERYALFIANSIGFAPYEVSRYSVSSETFDKIKVKLMQPTPFAAHENDDFKIFTTIKEIGN